MVAMQVADKNMLDLDHADAEVSQLHLASFSTIDKELVVMNR